VGVVVSTYGAGELCTFGGLAGAHAENSKVVSLTGGPGLPEQKVGHRSHHMISGQPPEFDLFVKMVSPLTAGGNGAVVITPENCVYETERLIAAMMYHSKPINLMFPRDVPNSPVIMPKGELDIPLANLQSDSDALDAVVREILHRLNNARQACILPGYLLKRYNCVAEAKALVEASGLPFFVGMQDRTALPEDHPQFGGVYLGRFDELADPAVTEWVEACDCIIGLGPENNDFNSGFFSMRYDYKSTMNIMPHKTRVGMAMYENVEMKDVLMALAKKMPKRDGTPQFKSSSSIAIGRPTGEATDPISYEPFFERFQAFLKPGDIMVADTAISTACLVARVRVPEGVDVEAQLSWGAIGWGTPDILGHCIAAPTRRCIIPAGEGGHQMTANEMGTFYRYGSKPIFLTINNGGYGGERVTNRYPDEEYNDLAQWKFADIPAAMGAEDWYTARVTTLGELDAALAEAEKAASGVYIEVVIDPFIIPKGGNFMFTMTGALFGMPDRTWEGWLKEMEAKRKS
jgi:indolepyruvate decarboxylase